MIVTNSFGLMSDKKIKEYEQYCETNNKILIFDCAAAFPNHSKNYPSVISFHQTKPWGMGEGGCIVFPNKICKTKLQELINFGHIEKNLHKFSSNGKMSDIAAAFIIDRLDSFETYKKIYQTQYQRIKKISKPLGYECLSENETICPPNLPLIAPINIEDKNQKDL